MTTKRKPRLSEEEERTALAGWWGRDDCDRSIDDLKRNPHDAYMVARLSKSLLDMTIRPKHRNDGFYPLRQWHWLLAAKFLMNPAYPGGVHIGDEVRSGLLLYIINFDDSDWF